MLSSLAGDAESDPYVPPARAEVDRVAYRVPDADGGNLGDNALSSYFFKHRPCAEQPTPGTYRFPAEAPSSQVELAIVDFVCHGVSTIDDERLCVATGRGPPGAATSELEHGA